jgi:large subunit ribosomal protein L32e
VSKKITKEQALALRTRLKSKRPKFERQESWRKKRISKVWRKPDGIDSKARRRAKGWIHLAEIGYRVPRKVRNLHPSGYEEVMVRNVDDLAKVNAETQAVRVAHTVGMKKRAEIYLRAGEMHIYVLNPLPEEKPKAEGEEEAKEEAGAAEESAAEEGTEEEAEATVEEGEKKTEKTSEAEPEEAVEEKVKEETPGEEEKP